MPARWVQLKLSWSAHYVSHTSLVVKKIKFVKLANCVLFSFQDDGGETCVKIARNDCPCCMVCAGQLGQPCSGSNAPCDVTNHLVCDQDTRRCKKGRTKTADDL